MIAMFETLPSKELLTSLFCLTPIRADMPQNAAPSLFPNKFWRSNLDDASERATLYKLRKAKKNQIKADLAEDILSSLFAHSTHKKDRDSLPIYP